MAITFDNTGSSHLGSTGTSSSATVDITSAAVGALCLCWFNLRSSINVSTFTGWTSYLGPSKISLIADGEIWYREKQSGDTTFSVSTSSASVGTITWSSYLGYNKLTPVESGAIGTYTSGTPYNSPSTGPLGPGRWVFVTFSGIGGSGTTNITWPTPPTGLTTRNTDFEKPTSGNSPGAWVGDSNGIVGGLSQSYAITPTVTGGTANDGVSAILMIVPAPDPPELLQTNEIVEQAVMRAAVF